MLEGTEGEAKERQGQNCAGKNLLPNFAMKIKVAPFVFTIIDNQWKLTYFYNLESRLKSSLSLLRM